MNPVHPEYFADPFAWRCGAEWYAIGTGPAEAEGRARNAAGASVFPLLRSSDFLEWRPAGHALVRPDARLGDACWAPEVVASEGRWYLYYSIGHGERRHHLRVAIGESPLGPYRDHAALTDPDQVPFAIDPHPFRDVDGRWYLFHARDFLDETDEHGRPVRAGTALVVQPLEQMTRLGPGPRTVARARREWQRYESPRRMYGGSYDWHTLEGPCVVRHGGRYWCLYSGGCWRDASYGVDWVSAGSVLGEWSDDGVEAGPRVLRSRPREVLGPGHCSLVEAPDGAAYLAYHAWDPALGARRMCLDPLEFTAAGPRCDGPSMGRTTTRPGSGAG